jgi:hypothetical protein
MSLVTNTAPTRAAVPLLGWAALALATMAFAVVLILAITSDGDTGVSRSVPAATAPGVRYDGGPEEGTRGPSVSSPATRSAPAVRFDGGPEEGTRGPSASSPATRSAPSVRYDGGPEEGTRGPQAAR